VRVALEPICDLPHFVSVHAIGLVGFFCHFRCRRMYRPGWREAASVRRESGWIMPLLITRIWKGGKCSRYVWHVIIP
jgi:hypothetical protein